MAVPLKQMEVDRVLNLVRGFGWDQVEVKFVNAEIILTIKKTLTPEQLAAAGGPGPGPG